MPNKNQQNEPMDESTLIMPESPSEYSPENLPERRKISRQHDGFYQIVVTLNIVAWILLLAALVVFHYARPEFITGVQNFWGIDGRDFWSEEHLDKLLTLLQICLVTTIVTIVLRSRRNRRKTDGLGINILILLVISVASLATIYMTV